MRLLNAILFLIFASASVFCQTVIDYFPVSTGNSWTYANASGKTTDVILVKNSMPDKDGTSLYLFEHQLVGMGTTSTMYSIKENKVLILSTKDILGSYRENRPPYPVELAPAGQEWRYNDRGDDLRYKTSKASCSFDGKTYNDCILVEERIVDGNRTLRTKRSYYAKNIGLVYVTLQRQGEGETVYIKLIDYKIVSLRSPDYDRMWEYENISGGIAITRYKGQETEVLMPQSMFGKPVVELKGNYELGGWGIFNIGGIFCEIPKKVTQVEIPKGVITIGDYAFAAGDLIKAIIPNTVSSIGRYAFAGNNLTEITIPDSVKSIGYMAFGWLNQHLETITIPANLRLDESTFGNAFVGYYNYCQRKAGRYTVKKYDDTDWEYVVWNNGRTSEAIITEYKGNNNDIVIPATMRDIPVVAIHGTSLSTAGDRAGILSFSDRKVTRCSIQNGAKYIGAGAFAFVIDLTTIIIPDSVTSIGEYAFLYTKVDTITIGNTVTIETEGIPNNFAEYYTKNDRKKGMYRYRNGEWNYTTLYME